MHHDKPSVSVPVPEKTGTIAAADSPSRRGFLGGIGALGFAAAMGAMADSQSLHAADLQTSSSPAHLSSVDNVVVLRDEHFDVVGGKEHSVQYVATDAQGASVRHSYNMTKINQSGAYTIAGNFRVERFALGQALTSTPVAIDTMSITVNGVQGDTFGNRRKDTVTTTIVGTDGIPHRETRTVDVRLDVSEFQGRDTAALARKMGNKHLGK